MDSAPGDAHAGRGQQSQGAERQRARSFLSGEGPGLVHAICVYDLDNGEVKAEKGILHSLLVGQHLYVARAPTYIR